MMRLLVAMFAALLAFPLLIHAEMYRWVDDNGVVTFKDTPPPASKKKKKKVKTYTDADFDPAPTQQPAAETRPRKTAAVPPEKQTPPKQQFNGTVELYVTSWCGYCKRARAYLDSKGVRYVAYDIEKDPAAKQRHKELGGNGVPLIIIGSNKISGFSAQAIDHYLGSAM
ncbi:MAG TPA: glutaredoxin domain-containing protein [Geobacteraceae bacterium]